MGHTEKLQFMSYIRTFALLQVILICSCQNDRHSIAHKKFKSMFDKYESNEYKNIKDLWLDCNDLREKSIYIDSSNDTFNLLSDWFCGFIPSAKLSDEQRKAFPKQDLMPKYEYTNHEMIFGKLVGAISEVNLNRTIDQEFFQNIQNYQAKDDDQIVTLANQGSSDNFFAQGYINELAVNLYIENENIHDFWRLQKSLYEIGDIGQTWGCFFQSDLKTKYFNLLNKFANELNNLEISTNMDYDKLEQLSCSAISKFSIRNQLKNKGNCPEDLYMWIYDIKLNWELATSKILNNKEFTFFNNAEKQKLQDISIRTDQILNSLSTLILENKKNNILNTVDQIIEIVN